MVKSLQVRLFLGGMVFAVWVCNMPAPPISQFSRYLALSSSLLLASLTACTNHGESVVNPDDKSDSGWIGADTFEVNTVIRAQAQQEAWGEWSELATDEKLQADLVDNQLKFIKNAAEAQRWRFNQLAGEVNVINVVADGDLVTIEYEATVDMLGRFHGDLPELADIAPLEFTALVPLAPGSFDYDEIEACSEADDGHSAAAYNFHYYFAPDKEGCNIGLAEAKVEITEVFNRPTVYPEYDKLMQDLGSGNIGFSAALVPNRGDDDPKSRFNVHKNMLENELGLQGVTSDDGSYWRYIWKQGDVQLTVDLYDPTEASWDFDSDFRARLGEYSLIHYNGHSSYGTKHLLDEPESFTDQYQVVMVHSCQSYAYYTRQVFRAKATQEDPSGFALADIVATGKSSYPSGSPPTVRVLLGSLMRSMVSIQEGSSNDAKSWIEIAEDMKSSTWGDIMYGVAGARTNSWQPEQL
ncbi:MAG: hypothetical protein GY811_04950 [Myxococcales bacterium]|nr:hypothetical protein [Myxococcales bacterium]